MKRDRDTWLAIGLGLILVLITITSVIQQTEKKAPIPYTSTSTNPDGTRALYLWLDGLEYDVSNTVASFFSILEEASTTILLEPAMGITSQEWETIDTWVQEGGTLLLAGNDLLMRFALRHYGFNLTYSERESMQITPQVPFLTSPPIYQSITIPHTAYLETERSDYVVLFAARSLPVIVTFKQGQGRIILSGTSYPFSNAGLKEGGNPALVLNLVTSAQGSGTIWFEEWHHGFRGIDETPIGLKDWLLKAPPGNAMIYAVFVIFIALFLQGRHFGKPIPLPSKTSRPAPIEYITAIANLNRRAGHQADTLRQYHHWLKRSLGQRYRINPMLSDEVYLEQLSKHIPDSSVQNIQSLFIRLSQTNISETEFVRLAAEVADWKIKPPGG
jgi:hypothetical protein